MFKLRLSKNDKLEIISTGMCKLIEENKLMKAQISFMEGQITAHQNRIKQLECKHTFIQFKSINHGLTGDVMGIEYRCNKCGFTKKRLFPDLRKVETKALRTLNLVSGANL